MARTWRWRERADAYDDAERARDRAALEQARRQERERRIAVLQTTAGKMAGVLNAKGAELAIRPTDAARLLLACQVELRKELDDEPRRRVVHAGDPEAPSGCCASTPTTTTARGRTRHSGCRLRCPAVNPRRRLSRSCAAIGSTASSTSTNGKPPEMRAEFLHGTGD